MIARYRVWASIACNAKNEAWPLADKWGNTREEPRGSGIWQGDRRVAREDWDLTRRVRRRSGSNRTFVSEIERGVKEPRLGSILRMSRALNSPAEAILGQTERRLRE